MAWHMRALSRLFCRMLFVRSEHVCVAMARMFLSLLSLYTEETDRGFELYTSSFKHTGSHFRLQLVKGLVFGGFSYDAF